MCCVASEIASISFLVISLPPGVQDTHHNIVQLEADASGVIKYLEPPVGEELSWLYGYDIFSVPGEDV